MPYGVVPSLNFPKNRMQKCPLCGTEQIMFIAGTVRHPENFDDSRPVLDRGYSFCNCRNIFFTDWSNIDQSVYDQHYCTRYDPKLNKVSHDRYSEAYLKSGILGIKKGTKFLEIGASCTFLLDDARELGAATIGLDYDSSVQENGHEFIHGDVESAEVNNRLRCSAPFDVIYMSHVIEHLKDPIKMCEELFYLLSSGGKILINMPDPFFINWDNVYQWMHLHLREHHILWDMGSFCEMMEEIGFKTILTKRNTLHKGGDCTMIFEKP